MCLETRFILWVQASGYFIGERDILTMKLSMYTVDHAEQTLQQQIQSEKTLRWYSIAVLKELCVKRRIQVDVGYSRPLKKPYIEALLTHVR